ncbi:phage tail protein [Phascolarctobacterium succinatutens]|uniref:phage tail protein n=1 Tax=Phascolarctobacterium succinatutens TaxID=626940 RepID=UPI003FD8AE78
MISIDAKNMEYAQQLLGNAPKEIELAAVNAINRTITKIKTQTSKSIRKNYLVSAKNIKGTLNIKRASRAKLRGVLASQGSPLLLTAFRVRANKRGPVKVQVGKQTGAKAVPGLFLGVSRKGYTGAMQRTQRKARYPLRIPYGPSIPQMFGSENVIGELTSLAEATLNKRFLHEVEYRFGKILTKALG